MIAIRTRQIVKPGGVLEIRSPQLPPPGTETEVLVLYESPSKPSIPTRPLTSLQGAAKGLFATPEEADQFISKERDAWEERLRELWSF